MFRILPPYFADRWPYRRFTLDGVTHRVWHIVGNCYFVGRPVNHPLHAASQRTREPVL